MIAERASHRAAVEAGYASLAGYIAQHGAVAAIGASPLGEGWGGDLRDQDARDGKPEGLGSCSKAAGIHGGAYDR